MFFPTKHRVRSPREIADHFATEALRECAAGNDRRSKQLCDYLVRVERQMRLTAIANRSNIH